MSPLGPARPAPGTTSAARRPHLFRGEGPRLLLFPALDVQPRSPEDSGPAGRGTQGAQSRGEPRRGRCPGRSPGAARVARGGAGKARAGMRGGAVPGVRAPAPCRAVAGQGRLAGAAGAAGALAGLALRVLRVPCVLRVLRVLHVPCVFHDAARAGRSRGLCLPTFSFYKTLAAFARAELRVLSA